MRLALLACGLALIAGRAHAQETLIIRNVHGYALQGERVQKFSTLIAINGKIDRLLDASAPVPSLSKAIVRDGAGQTMLPGLIDAHGHVLELGRQRLQVDLRGADSMDAALERVRRFASANRDSRWVLGRGWNQVLWPDKQFPTAAQLDNVIADRPVLLSRVDGHAIWVNSAALKVSGISSATPDPSGGQILRDAAGAPTGVLIDNATTLVERHLPTAGDADDKRALQAALAELASVGLTGVHDAGIDSRTYELYRELGEAQALPIRVYAMLADNKESRGILRAGPKKPEFDDRLQMRAVKAWADGALGSRGAALLEDYSDQPGHRGLTLYTGPELQTLAELTAKYGWQLNVHAIGDAANRITLDAFERSMTAAQRKLLRPRIEHAQVIALKDIPRFAQLDVIASIQPTHATSDMNMAQDRVGPDRIQGAYAWRKLKVAGARMAGGSDFPVELANPFYGLYAAVTRKDGQGRPKDGWYPDQKLSREEALRLFTRDAAFAEHMEDRIGTLQPGQWADFILIDRDYFRASEAEIDDIKVNATFVGGKQVFASASK